MKLITFINDTVTDYFLTVLFLLLLKSNSAENCFPLLSTVYLVAAAIILIIIVVYTAKTNRLKTPKHGYLFNSVFMGLIPILLLQKESITEVHTPVIIIVVEIIALLFAIGGILPIFVRDDKE